MSCIASTLEFTWRAPTSSATIHSLPFGLRSFAKPDIALQIDARSCVELVITEYIDATNCVDFAKPCLASQSFWDRRANCGLWHYWLEPFNCPCRLRSFARPEVAPLNDTLWEGLQPVVQQSTICPTGSGALRSQTWLRKIDARNCVDVFSYQPLDATFSVDFEKPCLASQSSWTRRANCGLLHYWLEPFTF